MKLMVYGTLKQGWGNNRLLADAQFLGEAVSLTPFVLFNCGFPKAVPFTHNPDTHPLLPIKGEVFEVDEATLSRCDRLEGHPNWYNRQTIKVKMNDEEQEVMVYVMPTWQNDKLCHIEDNMYVWAGW